MIRRPTNTSLNFGESTTPDPNQGRPKGQRPSSRIGNHFEVVWLQARASLDRSDLPSYPWDGSGKALFYAWVNKQLLPQLDGSEEAAYRAITAWGEMLTRRELNLPSRLHMPVFRYFHQQLDIVRATTQTTDQAQTDKSADDFNALQQQIISRKGQPQ